MAADDGIVVIGGGAAADSFVHEYRAANGSGRVTVLSDDERAPYFRPSLTKELLRRETDEHQVGLDDQWYAEGHVDLRLRAHVSAIDLDRQTVNTADGPVGFDTLVVATGSSAAELPNPVNFEAAAQHVRPEDLAGAIPHGPDVEAYVAAARQYSDAGFDRVALVQVGDHQDGFFDFWRWTLRAELESALQPVRR